MTNRFQTPDEQFFDGPTTNYAPLAGGSLYFFASGTSTTLATYQDAALTTPNANPIVLDSAGRAGSIFLQNANYKVVLVSAAATTIWTLDPVRTSDFSGVAQFTTFAGNPNGLLPGTAGSGSTPTSVVWDSTDQLLYVCTATGTSASAVWLAINQSSVANVPPPQGYLTPTSQTPVSPDISAATTVYYTPFIGAQIPIFNGTAMAVQSFSEISCALTSAHAANTNYDLFVFSNVGVLTLVTGPAWNTNSAGGSTRGSGAGTSALTRQNGFWVNSVQITGRNGGSTFTIAAGFATYVGTMFTDSSAGQVSCNATHGQNRKWGIWNAYNRQPIQLSVGDATANWGYTSATIRASNNVPSAFSLANYNGATTANGAVIVTGLAEERIDIMFHQLAAFQGTGGGSTPGPFLSVIIGWNAKNATSGSQGIISDTGGGQAGSVSTARYSVLPQIGCNVAACCENATANAGSFSNANFFGTEAQMKMVVSYRG